MSVSTFVMDSTSYCSCSYIMPHIRYFAEDRHQELWRLEKRKITDYELIFVTQGTGRFSIGNRTYDVKPNDLILLKPNRFHSGSSLIVPFHFLCIHFDLYAAKTMEGLTQEPFALYEAVPPTSARLSRVRLEFPEYTQVLDSSYIHMLLRRILHESEMKSKGAVPVVNAVFVDLLISLFRQLSQALPRKAPSAEVEAVIRFISLHYMEKISLLELASHVHLQPTYLSGIFRRNTGHTLMEYIKSYRLLKAKALLLETDRKIGDIACSVGFYDLHHFSKVFREQEGLSPAQYRQMKL